MQLSERAMIVNLSIGLWSPVREDKQRANEIAAKYGSDPKMGKYRKYLIDPDTLKPLQTLRGEIRNGHYDRTLPWGNGGDQILSSAGYDQYRDWLHAKMAEYEALADAWCLNYPAEYQRAKLLLNGLWDESEMVSPEQIRSKFFIKVRYKPVEESADFRCNLADSEVKAIRDQITADQLADQQNANRETSERVRQTIGHMAESLKAYGLGPVSRKCRTCDGIGRINADASNTEPSTKWELVPGEDGQLTKVLRTDCLECSGSGVVQVEAIVNPFRDSLVGNVRDLLSTLPGLNITADPRIDQLISDCQRYLAPHEADTLRTDDSLRKSVAARADAIIANLASYGL